MLKFGEGWIADLSVIPNSALMTDLKEQVIALVAEERGISASRVMPASRLLDDLGMDGDDAVEFFREYERRFNPDLNLLYSHWARHFGPEGIGWSDYRFNLATLAAAIFLAVALCNLMPIWTLPLAGVILAIILLLGWWNERRKPPHMPVRVADLIEAAASGHWPLEYPQH